MIVERKKRGPVYSEGARRLRDVPLSRLEISKRVGVDKSTVVRWMLGDRLPDVHSVVALQREFDIPAATWTMRPGKTADRAA